MSDVTIDEFELEKVLNGLDFMLNRMDGVALRVIDWMTPTDYEEHHNAVEMLQRAYMVGERIREIAATAYGGDREARRRASRRVEGVEPQQLWTKGASAL